MKRKNWAPALAEIIKLSTIIFVLISASPAKATLTSQQEEKVEAVPVEQQPVILLVEFDEDDHTVVVQGDGFGKDKSRVSVVFGGLVLDDFNLNERWDSSVSFVAPGMGGGEATVRVIVNGVSTAAHKVPRPYTPGREPGGDRSDARESSDGPLGGAASNGSTYPRGLPNRSSRSYPGRRPGDLGSLRGPKITAVVAEHEEAWTLIGLEGENYGNEEKNIKVMFGESPTSQDREIEELLLVASEGYELLQFQAPIEESGPLYFTVIVDGMASEPVKFTPKPTRRSDLDTSAASRPKAPQQNKLKGTDCFGAVPKRTEPDREARPTKGSDSRKRKPHTDESTDESSNSESSDTDSQKGKPKAKKAKSHEQRISSREAQGGGGGHDGPGRESSTGESSEGNEPGEVPIPKALRQYYSVQEKADAIKAYKEAIKRAKDKGLKMSIADVAKEMGMPSRTLQKWINKIQPKMNHRTYSPEEVRIAVEQTRKGRKDGMTWKELEQELEICRRNLRRWIVQPDRFTKRSGSSPGSAGEAVAV